MFAYGGIEVIGITPGSRPEKSIRAPLTRVPMRICGILCRHAVRHYVYIYPWNQVGTNGSPFVLTRFNIWGLPLPQHSETLCY